MSAQELDRLTVIERVLEKQLTQVDAGKQLGITPRQVRRLIGRYRRDGAAGLLSKKRGKRSNNAYPEDLKNTVIALVRQDYYDFGPTLIAAKLDEKYDIQLSRETIRQWLRDAGIWKDRQQRRKRVHQPRYRRDCFGELIQIDGSQHRWFEDRGPKCTLLVYIDDATGRLMELRLEGIDTMDKANAFLPTFVEQFNTKFAKEPAKPTDLHRPLSEFDDLDETLTWQEDRTVSRSLTVQYDRVVYLLEPTDLAKDLQRKKVRVFDYPDGTVAIKYQDAELAYAVFDKVRQVKQADIVSNKRLGSVLQIVKEQQPVKSVERSKSAPQRRGQKRICKKTYRKINPAALPTTEQSTA